jgi:hypothetical protein
VYVCVCVCVCVLVCVCACVCVCVCVCVCDCFSLSQYVSLCVYIPSVHVCICIYIPPAHYVSLSLPPPQSRAYALHVIRNAHKECDVFVFLSAPRISAVQVRNAMFLYFCQLHPYQRSWTADMGGADKNTKSCQM